MTEETNNEFIAIVSPEMQLEELRSKRNLLLIECDWTQLPDVPESIRKPSNPSIGSVSTFNIKCLAPSINWKSSNTILLILNVWLPGAIVFAIPLPPSLTRSFVLNPIFVIIYYLYTFSQ